MQMDNNALRKYLKQKIEEITGWKTSFSIAVDVNEIPYITFEYVELALEQEGKHLMELTVDGWDKFEPKNIITAIDALDNAFKKYKALNEDFMIQIYLGSNRQFIEDEDKDIKRLQRKYDLIVYERK